VPKVPRFYEVVIRMYFHDHDPPHFHAFSGGQEAQVQIAPFRLIAGALPARALGLVAEWATQHEGELSENWRRARSRVPLLSHGTTGGAIYPRVTSVKVLAHYVLELTFADGTRGVVDLAPRIGDGRGVFAPHKDAAFFAQVRVDREAGTIVWPNDTDLDPDVLYEAAHGLNTLKPEPGTAATLLDLEREER
jgi:hypothetical protein